MEIYNGYSTDDVIMDEPYIDKDMTLYPILTKQMNKFEKVSGLLKIGEQHIEKDLLEGIILNCLSDKCKDSKSRDVLNREFTAITNGIADIISMVTRKKIINENNFSKLIVGEDKQLYITFKDEDYSININQDNWVIFRRIVMMQNNIQEEKVYEDKLYAKWLMKTKIAEAKGKDKITIGDMIVIISCYTGKSYDVIKNQNMLETYCDYYRINYMVSHDTSMLFRTVSNDVPPIIFSSSIIEEMFRDKDGDYSIDSGEISKQL